ncbi:MAG TPA: hypothetical protein VN253_15175 [Kofleriaceae bacterium]|nr:hypothetical protein [Kofleriaceae bacterium]
MSDRVARSLIRAHGNPRGVADPEGKLAELEAEVERLQRGGDEET